MYIFINEMVLIDNERNKINRASIMGDARYWLHNPQHCMTPSTIHLDEYY